MSVDDARWKYRPDGQIGHSSDPFAELHARITSGDTSAINQLAEHLLPALKRQLHKRQWLASSDQISDAVEDAILEYASRPSRFDTSRGVPLNHLLLLSARRNLLNLLQTERRRQIRERSYAGHVRQTLFGSQDGPTPNRANRLWLLSVTTNEDERRAFQIWLEDDHASPAMAAALGLVHLSEAQQQDEVRRFKDRVMRRLRRKAERARKKI